VQGLLSLHAVPPGALPWSAQTGNPLVQTIAPRWHWSAGVHAVPEEHAPQLPAWQYIPTPQLPPSGALPWSAQTGKPLEQTMAPRWHWSAGVHELPAEHAPQVPAWQTIPAPQPLPSGSRACWHPLTASQESVVQGFRSSQFAGGPPTQAPVLQWSSVVQAFASSQGRVLST
jgi:hypothetical protein